MNENVKGLDLKSNLVIRLNSWSRGTKDESFLEKFAMEEYIENQTEDSLPMQEME